MKAIEKFSGKPSRGWMGPGLAETFNTPDYLKEAGIEYVADFPMDDQPFEVKTEHGPLISIPNTAGLNDIPMMIVQDHTAAELYDRCMGNFERLYQEGDHNARVMAIAGPSTFRVRRFGSNISNRCWMKFRSTTT